jgi:phosphohistidine swiveling domain-containing protein
MKNSLPFLNATHVMATVKNAMGAKARNLSDLLGAGFPVPNGFVLFEPQSHLEEAIEQIGGFPVAVRSSGALEDLPNASFAGLYETFLFVRSMDELYKAIHECFESKNSERVRDYLETKKIVYRPEDLKMSVLVQKMVDAKVAGVLFTMNPTNGHEEEAYIEYCEGVGERLVSGHVTPTRVSFDWIDESVLSEEVNSEGTRLDHLTLKELVELGTKIQAYYGKPQDIEWAIDGSGKLFVLQSRPVTSYLPREDRPELTNADFKDGGISARVCTPLMFSAYRNAMQFSMGDYLKKIKLLSSDEGVKWIYSGYGRVYWNAQAVKGALKKIPDFKEEDFDRDLGIQKDYGALGPHRTEVSVASVVGAIPVLMGLNREFEDCLHMIEHFRFSFEKKDKELKEKIQNISQLPESDFYDWLLSVILFQNETERKYFRTIYNNSNYQSEFKSLLKKLPAYEFGDEVNLMGELHGVSHLDVQSGLHEMHKVAGQFGFDSQQYLIKREEFLDIHYHHGPAELDLTVSRWGEKKEWVDELVRSFVPSTHQDQGHFKATCDRLEKKLSFLTKRKFRSMLHLSRKFLRVREEMRSYSTRAYYLLRMGILEFARRKNLVDLDVFMLDLDEVKAMAQDRGLTLPDLAKRHLYYQGYRHVTPPNEFGGKIMALQAKGSSDGLKGLGCSPGEFIGRARVITDIHQTQNLKKEDILVTLFTDPGWTPVLARVGGVITEVGGLLSHAAVIGREYGIPAILNLIRATQLIQDGDLIKMNGKTGVVEVLEKAPKS